MPGLLLHGARLMALLLMVFLLQLVQSLSLLPVMSSPLSTSPLVIMNTSTYFFCLESGASAIVKINVTQKEKNGES